MPTLPSRAMLYSVVPLDPLGEEVRRRLREAGLSQERLARLSCVPQPTISRVMNSKQRLERPTAFALLIGIGLAPREARDLVWSLRPLRWMDAVQNRNTPP